MLFSQTAHHLRKHRLRSCHMPDCTLKKLVIFHQHHHHSSAHELHVAAARASARTRTRRIATLRRAPSAAHRRPSTTQRKATTRRARAPAPHHADGGLRRTPTTPTTPTPDDEQLQPVRAHLSAIAKVHTHAAAAVVAARRCRRRRRWPSLPTPAANNTLCRYARLVRTNRQSEGLSLNRSQ